MSIRARVVVLTSPVGVYKAMGGGWVDAAAGLSRVQPIQAGE